MGASVCHWRSTRREPPLTTDDSSPLALPSTIGPFRVLHQLGSGVLGPVFRVHDPSLNRLLALKVFRLDVTPEAADAIRDDLDALVSHWPAAMPGLVRPIAAGVTGGLPWLAQDLVVGESLDVVQRRRGLKDVDGVVALVRVLAEALDRAATEGWAHGALHPRDVLVTGDLQGPVVTGIGVASVVERAGFRAPRRRPFVAPERVAGHTWDTRADQYALAVMTLGVLGRDRSGAASHLSLHAWLSESGLDAERWSRVFATALADDPAQRYRTHGEFADALERAARGDEGRTPRLPLDEPLAVHGHHAQSGDVDHAPAALDDPGTRLLNDDVDLPLRADDPAWPTSVSDDVMQRDLEGTRSTSTDTASDLMGEDEPVVASAAIPAQEWMDRSDLSRSASSTSRHSTWLKMAVVFAAGLLIGFVAGAWALRGDPSTAPPRAVTADGEPAVRIASDIELIAPTADAGRAARPPAAAPSGAGASTGVLRVDSRPTGARVEVDGRARGFTPLVVPEMTLGTHRLVVARQGYASQSADVTLSSERPHEAVSLRLVPVSQPAPTAPTPSSRLRETRMGAVRVITRPAGARVFIDGRAVGRTPVTLASIPAGRRRIRIERDGYQTWNSTVDVDAGRTRRIAASLVAVRGRRR